MYNNCVECTSNNTGSSIGEDCVFAFYSSHLAFFADGFSPCHYASIKFNSALFAPPLIPGTVSKGLTGLICITPP